MKKLTAKKFSSYQNLANGICKEFQKRGFICYWVGGALRDLLLNRKNFDIDLATNATPEEIKTVLKFLKLRFYTVGEKFGTIGAITKEGNIEITTFRSESVYSDSRHPDKIKFVKEAKEDSSRRDFTVNALYFDPVSKEVLDFHNGQKNLEKRIIKFVGDANKRIKEDPLRLLRAVRFAADLNFKLAPKDLVSIQTYAKEIKKVSSQRIKIELDKIFSSPNFIQGILLLDKTNLLKNLFPEVDNLKKVMQSNDYHAEGNAFNHTINALRNTKNFDLTLRYAVLFHDTGKAFTAKAEQRKGRDHISFHGHAQKSGELFWEINKRINFGKHQSKQIAWLLKHHMDLLNFEELNEKTYAKWAKNEDFGNLVRLRMADSLGGVQTDSLGRAMPKDISKLKKLLKIWEKLHADSKKSFLTGEDVMRELKIKSGKYVGIILEKIKTEQIFGRIKNKSDALKYLKSIDNKKRKNIQKFS